MRLMYLLRRRPTLSGGITVGLLGLLLCGLGLLVNPRQAYMSYLTAYATGLSLGLGALTLVMTSHVTGARWFVTLRPLAEAITGTLPLFALLFLPLLPGLRELYPWVPPRSALSTQLQEQMQQKQAYLNVPFFLLRAAGYFAVWIALSISLRRFSRRTDRAESDLRSGRLAVSAVGLPALGLTLTFAAFDWLMSLSPAWFSTIYGLYYFAGGFLGALALMAVLAFISPDPARLAPGVTVDQYYALGKLLLTLVLFWAYIAYSQLLIIWIGDVPVEVTWYAPRMKGSWAVLGTLLIVGQFALPFLVLLFRAVNTRAAALAAVGAWLLVMHYLDLYWLILPELHPDGVHPHWLDVGAVAAIGGLMLAWGTWSFRRSPGAVAPVTARMLGTRPHPDCGCPSAFHQLDGRRRPESEAAAWEVTARESRGSHGNSRTAAWMRWCARCPAMCCCSRGTGPWSERRSQWPLAPASWA